MQALLRKLKGPVPPRSVKSVLMVAFQSKLRHLPCVASLCHTESHFHYSTLLYYAATPDNRQHVAVMRRCFLQNIAGSTSYTALLLNKLNTNTEGLLSLQSLAERCPSNSFACATRKLSTLLLN